MHFSVVTVCGVLFVLMRLLGRLWCRLEDNIKMKFKEIGWGNGVVSSGAGGNTWWADVNTVMNCAADVVGCIEEEWCVTCLKQKCVSVLRDFVI
jgi:hypothetical protein